MSLKYVDAKHQEHLRCLPYSGLYYRLWKCRYYSGTKTEEETEILEELNRREGERER